MKDLSKRFVLSGIAIPLVFCFLIFAFHPWFRYAVVLFVGALACVATWEYEQFVKEKAAGMLLSILTVFVFFEIVSFFIFANFENLKSFPLIFFFISFLSLFVLHFKNKDGSHCGFGGFFFWFNVYCSANGDAACRFILQWRSRRAFMGGISSCCDEDCRYWGLFCR